MKPTLSRLGVLLAFLSVACTDMNPRDFSSSRQVWWELEPDAPKPNMLWGVAADETRVYASGYYRAGDGHHVRFVMAVDRKSGNLLWRDEREAAKACADPVAENCISNAYGLLLHDGFLYATGYEPFRDGPSDQVMVDKYALEGGPPLAHTSFRVSKNPKCGDAFYRAAAHGGVVYAIGSTNGGPIEDGCARADWLIARLDASTLVPIGDPYVPYESTANDEPNDIAVSDDGTVFVTGFINNLVSDRFFVLSASSALAPTGYYPMPSETAPRGSGFGIATDGASFFAAGTRVDADGTSRIRTMKFSPTRDVLADVVSDTDQGSFDMPWDIAYSKTDDSLVTVGFKNLETSWHIEKRKAEDLSLDVAFGDHGQLSLYADRSRYGYVQAHSVAVDPVDPYVYVVGCTNAASADPNLGCTVIVGGDETGKLIRRRLTDGAGDSAAP